MPPSTLRAILEQLHWSSTDLADLLGCNDRLIRRWAAGTNPIPSGIAAWLERRVEAHRLMPPPAEWQLNE